MTDEERLKKEIAALQRHLEKSRALEKTPILLGEESVKNLLREALAERDRWREMSEKLAEAVSRSRGQWIHSVNAEICLSALAQFEEMKAGKQWE